MIVGFHDLAHAWQQLASLGDLDHLRHTIALFNVDGTFYAIDNTCTHQGGPLGEGELYAETVTCPWHGAKFNVQTGAVTGPPAVAGVRTFAVEIEGGDVLVELE